MDPLKIYIAGPYTAPTEAARLANVQRAIDAGLAVWQKGHWPYIPHLTYWVDQRAQERGFPITYEDYLALDMVWLSSCDALLYLGPSPGADLERTRAMHLGLIYFGSVNEVPMYPGSACP